MSDRNISDEKTVVVGKLRLDSMLPVFLHKLLSGIQANFVPFRDSTHSRSNVFFKTLVDKYASAEAACVKFC